MGMYTNYEVIIKGKSEEIEKLNSELTYLQTVYKDNDYIDENLAKSKDIELMGTIFYYGLNKDEITKNESSYSDSITWDKICYEYYLYNKFRIENKEEKYYFSLNTIQLDYVFKKSLKENNIQCLDDYFHFYEVEYQKQLHFDELKQFFGDNTFSFSSWWDEVLYPILGSEVKNASNEIILKYEVKGSMDLLFEILSKNFNIVILVTEKYEEYNKPTIYYYFNGDKIDKKTYNEVLSSL